MVGRDELRLDLRGSIRQRCGAVVLTAPIGRTLFLAEPVGHRVDRGLLAAMARSRVVATFCGHDSGLPGLRQQGSHDDRLHVWSIGDFIVRKKSGPSCQPEVR
jgi:hypothetical protein